MSLVQHNKGYRRAWMFSRPIRKIYPWKIAQILSLFQQYIGNTSWSGNQDIQDAFCKALEQSGLKKPGAQYDPKSGGPRTYFAQLASIGLFFKRDSDNSIWLTKAGEDIVNGKPPLPIMQRLILKHQFPSIYSLSRNIKINPQIKIKPFLFVLELMQDTDIKYLSNKELIIPVLYGHNADCYNVCKEKIFQLRAGRKLLNIIDDKSLLYTPKTATRQPEAAIEDFLTIGNTCKNYLEACCLVEKIDDSSPEEKYQINPTMQKIISAELAEKDNFISITSSEESFQRAYGAWDRQKDTRLLSAQNTDRNAIIKSTILSAYFEYAGTNTFTRIPVEFVEKMRADFGFGKDEVLAVISPHLTGALSYFESTFIEYSKGGTKTAIQFEKAVCNLFHDRLLFKTRHTGQAKRAGGTGGYADIFAVALDDIHCALLDTKASPQYKLGHDDLAKMLQTYIPSYTELCGGRPLKLEFCSYIAGGFSDGVGGRLQEMGSRSNRPVSAISAYELLQVSYKFDITNDDSQKVIRKGFSKSKVLHLDDFSL